MVRGTLGHSTQTTSPRRILPGAPAGRVFLRLLHSPDAARVGAHFDLTAADSRWTFGRSGQVPIDDSRLSRKHCTAARVSGAIRVDDEKSSNGTFVQGARIEREYLLPNGVLRIGD